MAEVDIDDGHGGAGDNCGDEVVFYGGSAALGGGAFGAVEACFLKPIPGSIAPMIIPAFKLIVTRAVLIGSMGTAFAVGACTSARLRNKDDYKNAAIGGMLAGSIFGFKTRSWAVGLRFAAGLGIAMGLIKFRNGTYLPYLPPPQESYEVKRNNRPMSD